MSLITVDLRDRKQLYEQIIDNVKELILSGELEADEKLPSVRSLAKELGINPNTIQKAYTELERQGIIMTMPGRGSIVLTDKKSLAGEKIEAMAEELEKIAQQMRSAGIGAEDFVRIAKAAYERSGGTNAEN